MKEIIDFILALSMPQAILFIVLIPVMVYLLIVFAQFLLVIATAILSAAGLGIVALISGIKNLFTRNR